MHRFTTSLFRFLTIALTAVTLNLGTATTISAQQCPAEVEAIPRGDIAPNGPAIASQCPEACTNKNAGGYVSYGWGTDFLDYIEIQCLNAQQTSKIFSTPVTASTASTCWNCVGGCAGSNCPPGELCIPVPRLSGSDCQRYGCPAGYTIAERQAVVNGQMKTQPYCTLIDASQCTTIPPIPAITVQLEGPATIRTGGQCTWTANAFGGSTAPKTYTWYVSNNPVGYGAYYTGGRPSGTLIGASWRLRVTATDGVRYTSQEILVKESATAPICMQ